MSEKLIYQEKSVRFLGEKNSKHVIDTLIKGVRVVGGGGRESNEFITRETIRLN